MDLIERVARRLFTLDNNRLPTGGYSSWKDIPIDERIDYFGRASDMIHSHPTISFLTDPDKVVVTLYGSRI